MPKVKIEKIIKAQTDKVFSTITDFENLPIRLPEFFKSINIISKEGNTIVIHESVRMAGKDITQTTKHLLIPPTQHEVFILDGDAKDSHIVERYVSFDNGTKIIIDGDFHLEGKLKLVGFIAKKKIEKNINEILDALSKLVEQ